MLLLSKIDIWRDYKARYESESQENFTLTEHNITLRTQLNTAKEALQQRIRLYEELLAEQEGIQDNLSACVTYLQETVQPMLITYQGRIADLEESNGDYLAYVQAVDEAKRKRQKIPSFTEFQHQKGAATWHS